MGPIRTEPLCLKCSTPQDDGDDEWGITSAFTPDNIPEHTSNLPLPNLVQNESITSVSTKNNASLPKNADADAGSDADSDADSDAGTNADDRTIAIDLDSNADSNKFSASSHLNASVLKIKLKIHEKDENIAQKLKSKFKIKKRTTLTKPQSTSIIVA